MSALYVGRVLSFDSVTKNSYVIIPQLQGSEPVLTRAYLDRPVQLTTVPDLLPGDPVLVFYDGGDTNTQAYWTLSTSSTADGGVRTGSQILWAGVAAGAAVPAGYALCNGGTLSRTTEAALFAIIGTFYGAGDGSTTFNRPTQANHIIKL